MSPTLVPLALNLTRLQALAGTALLIGIIILAIIAITIYRSGNFSGLMLVGLIFVVVLLIGSLGLGGVDAVQAVGGQMWQALLGVDISPEAK